MSALASPETAWNPDRPWVHVSPSQLETFARCRRLWALTYGEGRPPPTQAMEDGSAYHTEMENWLKFGTVPPSAIVRAAVGYWPIPKTIPEEDIEHDFSMQIGGVKVVGKIDVLNRILQKIGDHKFIGNVRWVKTPEELKRDIQARVYAWYAHYVLGWMLPIKGQWVFTPKTQTPEAICVEFEIDKSDLDEIEALILALSTEMGLIYDYRTPPMEVAPRGVWIENGIVKGDLEEFGTCKSYGGCYFRDRCSNGEGNMRQGQKDQGQEQIQPVADFAFNRPKAQSAPSQIPPPTASTGQNVAPGKSFFKALGDGDNFGHGSSVNPPESTRVVETKAVESSPFDKPPKAPPQTVSGSTPQTVNGYYIDRPPARRGRPPNVVREARDAHASALTAASERMILSAIETQAARVIQEVGAMHQQLEERIAHDVWMAATTVYAAVEGLNPSKPSAAENIVRVCNSLRALYSSMALRPSSTDSEG